MTPRCFLPPVLLISLAAISWLGAATVTDHLKWPVGAVPGGETNGPDTLDDIWQGKFDAWGIDPAADEDDDTRTNLEECIEGTDPYDADDRARFGDVEVMPSEVLFTADVKAGKRYRVLSSETLAGSWIAETLQDPVSGTTEYLPSADQDAVSFSIATPAPTRTFFRLETSDSDGNADGVTDWVAIELGLNPASTDSDNDGVSDADQITTELTTQDMVTVTAENAFTTEAGGQPGMLMLHRNHSLLQATTVFTTSGTATAGTDFTPPASPVNFPRGSREVTIPIMPMEDSPTPELEGGESVTVSLESAMAENGAPLLLGAPQDATVIILDPTVPSGTGLLGQYYDTSNGTYTNAANFNPAQLKVTRVDPVINFNWLYGTPNDVTISGNTTSDNYSSTWEGYLQPTTAGDYQFQLDGDDKARVLLDLDNNGTFELPGEQIVEHGWDTAATGSPEDGLADDETIGTFKQSAAHTLAVPGSPAARYKIRVEHVETTGEARCRLQWRRGTAAYANIPNANVLSHTRALTNYTVLSQVATINTAIDHGLSVGNPVTLHFSSGTLFTPPANFSGTYNVLAVVDLNTFTISVPGASNQATGAAGFMVDPASTTQGYLDRVYTNTTFTSPAGRVGVLTGGPTNLNNGIWGSGSPDPAIGKDSFSVRWTGQVQPQFSEEYTFLVLCDDAAKLWINGEEQTLRVAGTADSSGTYTYDSATGLMVVTHPNIIDGSFVVGETVRIDPTSGNVSGGYANWVVTAVTAVAGTNNDTFTFYRGTNAETSFNSGSGNCSIEWLNKPIGWTGSSNITVDRYARINLVGGLRYDIKLDYLELTTDADCRLRWSSLSQPAQVIPSSRLYPANAPQTPPVLTSETDAIALVGGPFSYQLDSSNGGSVSASGLPPGVSLIDGKLVGTPTTAGIYQIIITTTSGALASTSLINLQILETDGELVREYWTGVSGITVADIPVDTEPSGTNILTFLEAATDFGDDYGARIRGYITAPVTGNYYFWIAASNAAELWISNDHEPINSIRRASVVTGSATPQDWGVESSQKSPWLALEAGQRYYIEILHKAGIGPGDNLSVGWAMPDTSATATVPGEVVPEYTLSRYVAPAPGSTPGTLYIATMLAQGEAISSGVGSSTIRLSEDETTVIMKYSYENLTGPIASQHIHTDPYLTHGSTIVYDIDTPETPGDGIQPDGSYLWTITPRGTLSAADIVEILKQGKAYINLHTALYPAGEVRGNYTLAAGSRTFSPPPAPPATDLTPSTPQEAARFLTQATYGPNIDDINTLLSLGSYEDWIDEQFTKNASVQLPEVYRNEAANIRGNGAFDESLSFNAWWFNSISGEDQLRQRIAFALNEVLVVSAQGPLDNNARALSYYYDELAQNAFGNFRDIIEIVTLTPTMGRYLDMLRNDKPDLVTGRIPNENYAREIKQLFSVGLFRLWPDGTLMLTSEEEPIDVYSQREIVGFAHVFTGWDYGYDGAFRTALTAPTSWTRPMREVPARHFTGPKRILNNEVLPGLPTVGNQPLDPYATHNSQTYNDPDYQDLASEELELSHDQLFQHPNVGPFICRQLIQRLVTSHPSRDYLYRVVRAFNDNGFGVRGDMRAVIKAILLDFEARDPLNITKPAFGKQREPLLRVAATARAFRTAPLTGTYVQGAEPNDANDRYIYITTDTPHLLASGNSVFLEFTDATIPTPKRTPYKGTYAAATPLTATTFRVLAKDWVVGAWSIPADSNICTVNAENHWLPDDSPTDDSNFVGDRKVHVDFYSGDATVVGTFDGVYTLTEAFRGTGTDYFKFEVPSTSASTRSGNLYYPRFSPGSYSSAAFSDPAHPTKNRIVTMDVDFVHELEPGDQVQLNFFDTRPALPRPKDHIATVHTVIDDNTWTFLAHSTDGTNLQQNQSQDEVYQFPLKPLTGVRNGTIGTRSSTFAMGRTNAGSLDQTPIDAPTVFNYFLPDFKYPGTLASQGLTTPEFQNTAETTVIDQANFFEDGIFNPTTNTSGLSSFKAGTNALVLDYSTWMGNATDDGLGAGPVPGEAWTSNANVGTLIEHFNILLVSGQLTDAGKAIIRNFIGGPIASVAVGNPCTITMVDDHDLMTGDSVIINDVTGGTFSPAINNTTRLVTVTGARTFTVDGVDCTSIAGLGLANSNAGVLDYDNNGPSSTEKRDRIRAILHLIVTSPDFITQR